MIELPVLIIDGAKTLPLYCIMGRTTEEIPAFGSGSVRIEYAEPEYEIADYEATANLREIATNVELAKMMVKKWQSHAGKFMYFVQFKSDNDKSRIKALHAHTEMLSIICDMRLKIDPSPLWKRFEGLFSFSMVHDEYRLDPDREEKWEHYAKRLKDVYERLDELTAMHLAQRMQTQIELLQNKWLSMDPLVQAVNDDKRRPIPLFYS